MASIHSSLMLLAWLWTTPVWADDSWPPSTPQIVFTQSKEKPSNANIVGGTDAQSGEFTFLARIWQEIEGRFEQPGGMGPICDGSLVSKSRLWVLTAAHCVDSAYKMEVEFGLSDRSSGGGLRIGVKNVFVHPKHHRIDDGKVYDDYDFALLELDEPASVDPIPLEFAEISAPVSPMSRITVTIAGWGLTRDLGSPPLKLQKADLTLYPDRQCRESYPAHRITEAMLCAGIPEGGKGICRGDSGGPLLLGSGDARRLVGVVSWSEGCAQADRPGVFARLSAAEVWIRGMIRD